MTTFVLVSFTGGAAAGDISIPLLKAGDLVLAITNATGGRLEPNFSKFVLTDGELYTTSGAFSGVTLTALFQREVLIS